jgi:hypothetical protein
VISKVGSAKSSPFVEYQLTGSGKHPPDDYAKPSSLV